MRRNPFEELEEFFDRMEEQFEGSVGLDRGAVAVDVVDAEEEYRVIADLPGYAPDDLDLTFSDGRLRIEGEREEQGHDEDDGVRYLRRERRGATIDRTVRIPDPIDEDAIAAAHENGVLTVTLPKIEPDEGTTIDIE